MPITLTWGDVALRLFLTVVCAGVLGLDRDERGRSAGLRTNLLVGLAACLAMIQTNWLINSNGKPPDSFVVMDIMRLPLGILSGIGFIGGGAILKRGELAVGVTTAATIWFVTVMGLCFGGGQLGLGVVGFVLGFIILRGLRELEKQISRVHSGRLTVGVLPDGPTQVEITQLLTHAGLSLKEPTFCAETSPSVVSVYGWKAEWKGKYDDRNLPDAVYGLLQNSAIQKVELTR
jgi:putative Mg2+ transporter-C (MgtC) family protein